MDFLSELNNKIKTLEANQIKIKCGTVTSVSPFQVKFDGESNSLAYQKPSTYTPTANDRVYFLCSGNKYVCLGKYE